MTTVAQAPPRSTRRRRTRTSWTPYLLLLPAVLLVVGVLLFPMARSILMSFQAWPFAEPGAATFVGGDNYARLVQDQQFWTVMKFTGIFTVLTIAVEFVFGLSGALVLDKLRTGRGLVMSIAVAPYMVAPIAVGLIWRLLLQGDASVVNFMAGLVGVEPTNWLAETTPAIGATVAAEAWRSMPFVLLILLAGLAAIPDDLEEAARIDGAGELATVRHLKLPLLMPYMAIALLFETVFKLRVFDLVITLTRGGPGSDTMPIGLLIQRQFFRYFEGGLASAASVILLVLGAVVATIYLRTMYREIDY